MVAEDRSLSFKPLFSRSLSADPERLHFAAHSHHLWPDASFEGQVEGWDDAARLADRKWDKVMDEVWPEAQAMSRAELGSGDARARSCSRPTPTISSSGCSPPRRAATRPLRVLTSDGEFHSARRQFARWEEAGWLELDDGRRRAVRRFLRALPRRGAIGRPRPDPGQPGAVRQRPTVRAGRRACRARPGRTGRGW